MAGNNPEAPTFAQIEKAASQYANRVALKQLVPESAVRVPVRNEAGHLIGSTTIDALSHRPVRNVEGFLIGTGADLPATRIHRRRP